MESVASENFNSWNNEDITLYFKWSRGNTTMFMIVDVKRRDKTTLERIT
jgi:hypothetical protein